MVVIRNRRAVHTTIQDDCSPPESRQSIGIREVLCVGMMCLCIAFSVMFYYCFNIIVLCVMFLAVVQHTPKHCLYTLLQQAGLSSRSSQANQAPCETNQFGCRLFLKRAQANCTGSSLKEKLSISDSAGDKWLRGDQVEEGCCSWRGAVVLHTLWSPRGPTLQTSHTSSIVNYSRLDPSSVLYHEQL